MKKKWKRPLAAVTLLYAAFLALVFSGLFGTGLKRFFYGARREVYSDGASFWGTAYVLKREAKTDGDYAVLRIRTAQGLRLRFYGPMPKGARVGDEVTLKGRLSIPKKASNPGEYDSYRYYKTRRIDYWYKADGEAVITGHRVGLRSILEELRHRAEQTIAELFPEEERGLVQAILLGDAGAVDAEQKSVYQQAGIAHLLAISGLHVMFVHTMLTKLLGRLFGKRPAEAAALVLIWGYVLMTGAAASTVRAGIMLSVRSLGYLLFKEEDGPVTVSVSALVILLIQPLYLLDAGFQLSFGAIAGLYFFLPLVQRVRLLPKKLRELMAPSAAVNMTTAPITLYHYFQLCPYSMLLNPLVVPLASFIILLSSAALFLYPLLPWAARFTVGPVILILKLYRALADLTLKLPGAVWAPGRPAVWQLLLYYGALFLLLGLFMLPYAKRKKLGAVPRCAAWMLLLSLLFIPRRETVFLNVGQGDCAIIENGRDCYMVDCGPSYRSVTGRFLASRGIHRIKAAFLSHPDADHMEGFIELFADERIHTETLYVAERTLRAYDDEGVAALLQAAEANGVRVIALKAGDGVRYSNMLFECQWPPPGNTGESDEIIEGNNASLVLRAIVRASYTILFPGDLETEGEEVLLLGKDRDVMQACLKADILKVAHHGSSNATGDAFLSAVSPALAVISSRRAVYGHPHRETLERLEARAVPYRITEDAGAVTVFFRCGRLRCKTYFS